MLKCILITTTAILIPTTQTYANEWTLSTYDNKIMASTDSYAGNINLTFICEPQKPILITFTNLKNNNNNKLSNVIKYVDNNDDVRTFEMDGVRKGIAFYESNQTVVYEFAKSIIGIKNDNMIVRWDDYMDVINMENYADTMIGFFTLCRSKNV